MGKRSKVARPMAISLAALSTAATVALFPTVHIESRLLARTLLVMPGNDNPNGDNLEYGLNNYFNPTDPNYGFPGYDMVKVPWMSDSFDDDPGYQVSQDDGVEKLDAAITKYLNVDDGEEDYIVAAGYSSSANVVIREMKYLDSLGEAAPSPDQIKFLVLGSPHRPNGGIFGRFPGFNLLGIPFEETNPDTQYELTDIGYEYDPISDFPAYPLMPLTLLNSLAGWQLLHISYGGVESDLDNAIDNPNMTYYDEEKGIQYITIAAPHLPLLMPAYMVADALPPLKPFIEPVLKLIEPTLKVLVDLGYNRDVPVGEHLPAQLLPKHDPAKVAADLAEAMAKGIADAVESITGVRPDTTDGVEDAENAAATSALTDTAEPATAKTKAQTAAEEPAEAETKPIGSAKPTVKPLAAVSERIRDRIDSVAADLGLDRDSDKQAADDESEADTKEVGKKDTKKEESDAAQDSDDKPAKKQQVKADKTAAKKSETAKEDSKDSDSADAA